MELFFTILLISLFLFIGIWITLIQLSWLNKEKLDAKHNIKIKNLILKKKYTVIDIITTSKSRMPKKQGFNTIHVSFGGTDFMSFEKVFYKIVLC